MGLRLQEQIALHRWAVIAEAANGQLTARERGALVRRIAAWRQGGLEALRPAERSDTGVVRAHPELFAEASALRLELPGRSAAQIASILYHRHGVRVSERTVRGQLRRAGLAREALAAEPKAYGRYEAGRAELTLEALCRGILAIRTLAYQSAHALYGRGRELAWLGRWRWALEQSVGP